MGLTANCGFLARAVASGVLLLGHGPLAAAQNAKCEAACSVVVTADAGVLVMRPVSGSFMRETTRQATAADARERRVAAQRTYAAIQTLAAVAEYAASLSYATQSAMYRNPDYSYVWLTRPLSNPVRSQKPLPPVRPFASPR
jgi:hypothetical protein